MHWQLSIKNSIQFLSYSSSSVGLDQEDQPSLPTCISGPWLPTTVSLVHHWNTFDRLIDWPLQTRNTTQELQFWRCSDQVIAVWPFYQTHELWEHNVFLLPNISQPLAGEKIISFIHFITSPDWCMFSLKYNVFKKLLGYVFLVFICSCLYLSSLVDSAKLPPHATKSSSWF